MKPTSWHSMWRGTLAASSLVLTLMGCGGMEVERTRNDSIAVSRTPTYAWSAATATQTASQRDSRTQEVNQQIRRAIETSLESKAYRKVPAEAADFLVEYQVGSRTTLRQATQYEPARQGRVNVRSSLDPTGTFAPPPKLTSEPVPAVEGSLLIVIRERASGKVFYQALGKEDDISGGVSEAKIQSAVQALLKDL